MKSQELYKKVIFDLILEYKIKVKRWCSTNYGWAYYDDWAVEMPKPISLAKFMTCAHEIGHLVKDKASNPQWKSEYIAVKYSLDICEKYNVPLTEKEARNNLNYLVSCIADDILMNNVDIKTIDKHVLEYARIDIKAWKSKIRKGYLPSVKSVKDHDGIGFYKIKTDWVKKKF